MSVKSPYPESVFPIAFGNELERGIVDDHTGQFNEPYELAANLSTYIPPEVDGHFMFLANGAKLYVGGSRGGFRTNIETATPECASPLELVRYMRASDFLLAQLGQNYVRERSDSKGGPVTARLHHRVVDTEGNRKGCHDNFGLREDQLTAIRDGDKIHPAFTEHLATRHFVTGAGFIRSQRINFSQKVNGLHSVRGYGYFGTMYRIDNENGNPRVEVRCSDPNISDWASWIRIGSTALLLAVLQTDLRDELTPTDRSNDATKAWAKATNIVRLRSDGTIASDKYDPLLQALDFQEKLAELAQDKLQLHTDDIPLEYFQIAAELRQYCQDMRKVMSGDATIMSLSDRADWAAKLVLVRRRIEQDRSFGIKRSTKDIVSRANDLRYDMTQLSACNGSDETPLYGQGIRLRSKGHFKLTIPDAEVTHAYRKAPTTTRAHLRARLVRKYDVTNCDWHRVSLHQNGRTHSVDLGDVTRTQLRSRDVDALDAFKPVR